MKRLVHPNVARALTDPSDRRRVARVLGRVRRYAVPALSRASQEAKLQGTAVQARFSGSLQFFELNLMLGREIAGELAERAHRKARQHPEFESMGKAQIALVSRGLLTASEVLALLVSGHGKGAMARARTIHELTVTSDFIAKRGLRAARRYVDYYDLDRLKAERAKLTELKKRRPGRKLDSERRRHIQNIEEDIAQLEARRARHIRRYGQRFKDEYGWAACWWRGKTRVNFGMIERRTKLDRARPYYKHASLLVHAGPLGVLDNVDETGHYITGPNPGDLRHALENAPVWLTHLLMTATAGLDGERSSLLPRVIAMSSLALEARDAVHESLAPTGFVRPAGEVIKSKS